MRHKIRGVKLNKNKKTNNNSEIFEKNSTKKYRKRKIYKDKKEKKFIDIVNESEKKYKKIKEELNKEQEKNNRFRRQKLYKNKIEKKFADIEKELEKDFTKIETEIKKEEKKDFVELGKEIVKEVEKNNPKPNNISLFKIIPLSLILMLILIITFLPVITFKENNVKIRYNTKYKDSDYKARSLIKDYTKKIKIISNVDTSKIGQYEIKYYLKVGFLTIKKTKKIEVIDDVEPTISLTGNETSSVCPGKEYKELGYKAFDEYDGDLTNKVKIENKQNEIIYKVKDRSGNHKMIMRKLVYKDIDKPKIELNSGEEISIIIGTQYKEPGYKAIDNCDGDITNKVEVSNNIDSNIVGNYIVTYRVKDNNNNESIVTRKVNVRSDAISSSNGGYGRGIVYLTFDDGPNDGTTNIILDILKEEGVQATFFVTCNGPDYLIKRMHDEGHTVALHTASHKYEYVYSSVNNYFEDLKRVSDKVKSLTGIESKIIRFPGGSSNTISKRISPGIMTTLTSEVRKRGYKYFDWNVDSNDAAGADTNTIYTNVTNNISLSRENVVLMHDIKPTTRDAIRKIIKYGKNNGFTFKKITMDTVMVTHGINN